MNLIETFRPPAPDPIAERIEAALDAGVDVTAAIAALDDLEAELEDREAEEDGGSLYEQDTGLAVNEYVPTTCMCACCGHVHAGESILIA